MRQKSSLSRLSGLDASNIVSACALFALLTASLPVATAQRSAGAAPPPVEAAPGAVPSLSRTDDRYRIGPGDVLEVRVFNRPQLSRDAVRVDGRGMIRMPLIEDEIQAACLTEGELAREIATRYLEYQRNPQVDVFVKEFQSQPVAVIGAVNAPGRFQLQRRVRLLELLSFAGGPSERAGRSVQVVHAAAAPLCEAPASDTQDEVATGLASYSLSDTLRGDDPSNPYVRPGDIITLPEAAQAFVVGNVVKPTAIAMREPITVSRAIAMAGGALPDTRSERVRIVRQTPGSMTKTEIYVNLKAIDRHRAEDVILQANDIVDVPTSGSKRFLRSFANAFAPAVMRYPVQVIR